MAAGLGFKDFTTGEVLTAADVDGYLMQGVWVFASAAARDSAVTSPQEGNFAYLKDTNVTTYYTGSAWANLDTTGMTNPMTTTGDTIYSSSGSTPARLGIGTAGQVLQVNSGATAPEWTTPAGGGWTLIATATPSSATTVSFTSIPTTYTNLHVVHRSIQSVGGNYFTVRFNNDSGGKYWQVFHSLGGTTTASNNGGGTFGDTSVIGNNNPQYNSPIPTSESGSGAGATGYSGIFTVFDYASTTNRRIYEWRSTGLSTVGDGYIRSMGEGYYNETATAITRLDFIRSSTQTINGQFFLYGEK